MRSSIAIRSTKRRSLPCILQQSPRLLHPKNGPFFPISVHHFSSILSKVSSRDETLPSRTLNNNPFLSFSSTTADESSKSDDTRDDFFGETITFLSKNNSVEENKKDDIIFAYDQHLLTVTSKGKSTKGGGDGDGVPVQMAHSVAMVWAELLEYILVPGDDGTQNKNNNNITMAVPMLAVAAIAPILIQADIVYMRRLDDLLKYCTTHDGRRLLSLMEVAKQAASLQHDECLTQRERLHLQALNHLLLMEEEPIDNNTNNQTNRRQDNNNVGVGQNKTKALSVYLRLLRQCPGDALALSMAIDLSFATGQQWVAFEAATICYAYWQDRRQLLSGYTIGASWIAVGLAAGGRFAAAEALVQQSNSFASSVIDLEGCGGIAAWAMALVLDHEGRVAEGISTLKGYDGVRRFEAAALLQSDSRLMGYGGRWALDREGQFKREESGILPTSSFASSPAVRRGRNILRIYDDAFDRIFEYSGYASQQPWTQPQLMAPIPAGGLSFIGRNNKNNRRKTTNSDSFFSRLFKWKKEDSNNDKTSTSEGSSNMAPSSTPSNPTNPEIVDVLTWIPPTPQLLTDATLLLLRVTLHGRDHDATIIDASDARWNSLRNAWFTLLKQYDNETEKRELSSMTLLTASLACHDDNSLFPEQRTKAMEGAALLGKLLGLGGKRPEILPNDGDNDNNNNINNSNDDDDDTAQEQHRDSWKKVVLYLLNEEEDNNRDDDNLGGVAVDRRCWDIDTRPLLEVAICYAAKQSKDLQALALSRAICSKGVALRSNSPEEWYRYSTILSELGDDQAAEQALAASISLGSGEGGANVH